MYMRDADKKHESLCKQQHNANQMVLVHYNCLSE